VDLTSIFGAVLTSVWLLPVLMVLIAADGPFPILPTETLLMSAWVLAVAEQNVPTVIALFLVAVVGSVFGDLAVFGLGRTSTRVLGRAAHAPSGLATWVRHHMLSRPGLALIGARFVPAGRLVSTAAAGRVGLPVRRFVPWSTASSAVWAAYMLVVGLMLGPLTGGNPLLALLAGAVMAVVTAGGFALIRWVRARRALRRDAELVAS
jgi:membrane protein DedA with SNARE-associated domain